jgi:hypothetical protein
VSRYKDKLLLLATAILVAVVTSGSFFFAAVYHVNEWFIFAAWNSILLVPLFIKDFKTHLSNYLFVAFLFSWAVMHGLILAALLRWTTIALALPILFVELTAGLALADILFGIRPQRNRNP